MTDTLAVQALLERTSLRPGQRQELHLLVDLLARGAPVDASRPALSVVFVLDSSGSMKGPPLEQVARSVDLLTDLLDPTDKVGVVAFSEAAAEVAPLRPLDADTKRLVKRRVAALRADGGTNIEAGLVKARAMFGPRTSHERQVILLLSDGAPNRGAASLDALNALVGPMRADVAVATLGYGPQHQADILHGIADAGGGQYWFIPDPEQAEGEFARALGAQGDVVADNVTVVMTPSEACVLEEALGHKTRFSHEGPAFSVPDLREDQKRSVVVRLALQAPREAGPLDVGTLRVRYTPAGSATPRTLEAHLRIDVKDKEPELVVPVHQAACMARAQRTRIEARQAADRGSFEQAAAMLRQTIRTLEQVPGYRPADGSPLSECVEQLIDEATMYEQRPAAERYASFRSSSLGIDVSQGARHAASVGSKSRKSAELLKGALGPALPGALVLRDALGKETARRPILPEMTVGRSADCEFAVSSPRVSRRHTRFFCKGDQFFVSDLGTTNGTRVNGQPLAHTATLKHGDRVQVGDVELEVVLDAMN